MYGVAVAKIKLLCGFLFVFRDIVFNLSCWYCQISENNAPSLRSSL